MHYRLYELDDRTGRIVSGQDVLADDDANAIRAAHGLYPDTPFEIWNGARRVVTVGGEGPVAAE
jgi:hypothetical protein